MQDKKTDSHYCDVIMGAMTSQITSLTIVYPTVSSGAERKHQSSASLAFVRGIHCWPVNSPHKWPVTRKMFPFDNVIIQITKHTRYLGLAGTIYINTNQWYVDNVHNSSELLGLLNADLPYSIWIVSCYSYKKIYMISHGHGILL